MTGRTPVGPPPTPQFCRLEYLTSEGWSVGHHGVNLLYPHRYPERLAANGKVGRVVIVETGEIINSPLATACTICDQEHTDGACLL